MASATSRRARSSPSSPSSTARHPAAEARRPGRLFVLSGPSGVGKGTVVRKLIERHPELFASISCTTRPPRAGERDGIDYRFVSPARFRELADEGAFLEWFEVHGHLYGTLRAPVAEALAWGRDVVLEIDVQGAGRVRERVPDAVLVFLQPPSDEELERRLRGRGTDAEADVERRLAAARAEMNAASSFDHVVVNDDVDRAAADIAAIIAGERDATS